MPSTTNGWICSQLHLLRQKRPPLQIWTNHSIGGIVGGAAAVMIANGRSGLDGQGAVPSVALAKNREIVKRTGLIGEAKFALVPSRSSRLAIFRIALWIVNGTVGVHGAHAPRLAAVGPGFGSGVLCLLQTLMEELVAIKTR
jgi:hypothetical protein